MRGWNWMILTLATVLLAGCSGSGGMTDLHQWVRNVESRHGGRIAPLPKIVPYHKFAFTAGDLPSPFSPARLTAGTKPLPVGNSGLHPDFKRPKGPLEAYPLDSLKMVGTLQIKGRTWALIQVPDGTIFPVHKGDYMGMNYGRIVRIGNAEVNLVEIVPDGMGGWMKHPASLALK